MDEEIKVETEAVETPVEATPEVVASPEIAPEASVEPVAEEVKELSPADVQQAHNAAF